MTDSLQTMRPMHGKGLKKNPWPGIIFVIGFHVVVIAGLAAGLEKATIDLLRGNLSAAVIPEEFKDDAPPPPPPPDFKPPPVVAVAPEVVIDLAQAPPPTNTTAISNTPPPAPPAPVAVAPPPPPPPPSPPICIPDNCARAHAVTADDYPPVSIRLQEQGIVKIKYTVQNNGGVADCSVAASSGKPRLDDAACKMVLRRWKFKPATANGKAVSVSLLADVTFQLK